MRKLFVGIVLAILVSSAAAQSAESFPDTASYGLFPIDGSNVSGTVQLVEEEGRTRVSITLSGIESGSRWLPVLFEGTCGPDREMVEAFAPVGTFTNDPFASIDHMELSVQAVESSEYFMYIFEGDQLPSENEDGFLKIDRAVACGQLGLGANR
ncbi:MAG TPA: hypothetical protein VK092_05490 [Deinococcales bacterium]|nr:hypothetical protein [Deinococcales bacterium]